MGVRLAVYTLFFLAAVPLSSSAAPFYTESFNYCAAQLVANSNANTHTGWRAQKSNSFVGRVGFLKMQSPGSPNVPPSLNAFPKGPDHGAVYWSAAVEGLSIFTEEIIFNIANLSMVRYDQRLSGYGFDTRKGDTSRLAFLINNTWYISDTGASQVDRGSFETITWDPRSTTYGISRNLVSRGTRIPTQTGVTLPASGIVTAFGLFFTEVRDRVRIDNFTLFNDALNSEVPVDILPDANCTTANNNIEPTIPEEGNQSPEASDDGILSSGGFCTLGNSNKLGRVMLSRKSKALMLKAVAGKSVIAKRDTAILNLLLNGNLRLDQLINVQVQDYFRVDALPLFRALGAERKTLLLSPKSGRLLDAYLKISSHANYQKLPLFQRLQQRTGKHTGIALCGSDLTKLLKSVAKKAKIKESIRIRS